MHKKLITACLALVAFAAMAVVPAFASASPVLTNSGGTAVTTGTEIVATNEGNITFTGNLGTITCSSSTLKGPLAVNSGTEIKGEITSSSYTGTGTESRCTSTWGVQFKVTPQTNYCLTSTGGDVSNILGGTCSKTTAAKFTLDPAGGGSCQYERASASSTYETNVSPLKTVVAKETVFKRITLEGTTELVCPKEGTLAGTYVLKTGAGGELKIS